MAGSEYYDEEYRETIQMIRDGKYKPEPIRNSIDDVTPEEWDSASAKARRIYNTAPATDNKQEKSLDIPYKYNEDKLIKEFKDYVDATYGQHYSRDKFQATEFIIDGGHGTGFCIGNVLKYAQRYGKKGTSSDARKDLMKVLHYALIQLYIHDTENS
jgi:hypothetical protein